MKNSKIITGLVLLITIFSAIATFIGITSNAGPGEYDYMSIRGENVTIYGRGLYQHMSADVAIQGIAQDYVTLFIGIPLLLFALFLFRKNNIKGLFLLSGILMYFLVTYLFYTAMGMYNIMFLVYLVLLCFSFFAFVLSLFCYNITEIKPMFSSEKFIRYSGLFLVINSVMVAILWLGIVIPPLLDGSIYPKELQHYTTLIVQGFDLGLLLPIGIVSGVLALKKSGYGYLFTTINLIFLSILMAALTSKILFMANAGYNVIPVIFIMPTICLISAFLSFFILKKINVNPGKI
ncbi:MAG: hypothetical protein PHD33_01250 [Atribacterota bacterium]|nr:hypothetical protein [Atribacterota bacterium]